MAAIRAFRNSDPPQLAKVWNEAFTGRGAVSLASSYPLEQHVLAKPIFDRNGLILAEVDDKVAGFVHAAVSQAPDPAGPVGVVCAIAVRPSLQTRGIGGELLRHAETYLRERGAVTLQAGGCYPHNAFYLGLYGGCDSPGFLQSDAKAEPFFTKHGYQVKRRFGVMQANLDDAIKIVDPRFNQLRNRLDIQGSVPRRLENYWSECILGFVEPVELQVIDRAKGTTLARSLVWEMEGFSQRWGGASIGLLRFEVDAAHRRQGIGKFLLSHLLRQIREQYFQLAEVQLEDTNVHAIRFLRSLGFRQVDVGQVYVRTG